MQISRNVRKRTFWCEFLRAVKIQISQRIRWSETSIGARPNVHFLILWLIFILLLEK